MMLYDEGYDREQGDDPGWSYRRQTRRYTTEFRPVRRDENAPIIALITRDIAACASDPDPDRWFDHLGGGGSSIADQKRLCAFCPLHQPCREYALTNDVLGIWGGTTASDRVRIRQHRQIKPAPVTPVPWLTEP